MRMPTRRSIGEGRTCGEEIDTRTHAIRRGSGHGTSEGWLAVTGGDPSRTRVHALINAAQTPGAVVRDRRTHAWRELAKSIESTRRRILMSMLVGENGTEK